MRSTLGALCVLGLLLGCERRSDQDTGAEVARTGSDTMATGMAATDTTAGAALTWSPVPPSLPAGARAAVLSGDPSKAGPFTLRLDMPDGYEIRPHHHAMAEHVRVVEGSIMLGKGKQWEDKKLETMAIGAETSLGAGQPHYVRVKGRTVVEVKSTGPFEITYENPADDPRKGASP